MSFILVLLGAYLIGLVAFAELCELFHEGLLISRVDGRLFRLPSGSALAFGFLLVLAGLLSGSFQGGLPPSSSHGGWGWSLEKGLPTDG
jgi:hypothetical protein